MKYILIILIAFSGTSCQRKEVGDKNNNQAQLGDHADIQAQATQEGTLKSMFAADVKNGELIPYYAAVHFKKQHLKEILETIDVVESVSIPKKDFVLVFYKFSVGTDIVRESVYMMQMEGKWYIYQDYFSEYSEDPFKNGEVEKGKELLKKKGNWEEDNNVWWA